MKQPSVDELKTPANGQIFALKRALNKTAVRLAFSLASVKASGRLLGNIIREKRTDADGNFWASFVYFPLSRRPPFLPKTHLEEHTYGFLLLLELQVNSEWFLGIFKRGSATLTDWLESQVKQLPRTKFINAFGDESAVMKMHLQRMTASRYELRAATYEAQDLQSSLPMMAASRCVIRAIRFRDAGTESIALTVSSSRVQRSGGRCSVNDLAEFVRIVVQKILADKRNAFLATFAHAIAIENIPPGTQPTSILFDWNGILEADSLELYRRSAPGEVSGRPVSKAVLQRALGDTFLTVPDGKAWNFGKNTRQPRGRLHLTSTKYSIKSILGNKLIIADVNSGETMSLAKWVRENDAYSVTFNRPEFYFCGGALYQRTDFQREIDAVRHCLQIEDVLSDVKFEKGDPKSDAERFPTGSVFRVSEDSIYAHSQWLCCMDLGDEWADYLSVERDVLRFIHCKGGKQTSGASAFQEVVAQGLKNLGRIRSTPQQFQEKLDATKKKKYWSKTKIERLRNGAGKWALFQTAVSELLVNPSATMEVHLVVPMLGMANFETSAAAPTPHFIQLIWLLASFINSCREMGARPVIICSP